MMNNDREAILRSLVSSDIIFDSLLPTNEATVLDSKELYTVLTSAYELGYDEETDALYYIDENGEKFVAPDMSEGLSTSAKWLCDELPDPVIDIDQGGSVRKSGEIKSLFHFLNNVACC